MKKFSTNFFLRSKGKDGKSQIRLVVTGFPSREGKRKHATIHSGFRVEPDQWNKDTRKVQKHSQKARMNYLLADLLARANGVIIDYCRDNESPKAEDIQQLLNENFSENHEIQAEDVLQEHDSAFWHVLSIYQTKHIAPLSQSIGNKWRTLAGHLQGLESALFNEPLSFDKIDYDFLDKFKEYCIAPEYKVCHSDTTVAKNLGLFNSFMNWAMERKYHENDTFRKFRHKAEEPEQYALTEEDLQKIEEYRPRSDKHQRIKDFFLMMIYTGQRYSDMEQLIEANITPQNGGCFWTVKQEKTGKIVRILLVSKAMEILQYYQFGTKQGLDFPTYSNQKFNKYVKELCRLAGLTQPITVHKSSKDGQSVSETDEAWNFISAHTARRTFVTLSLMRGMPPHVVMQITGHTDFKTLEKYIRFTEQQKNEQMIKIWG
jgi:integrase